MPQPASRFRRAVAAAVTFAVAALLLAGFSTFAEAKAPARAAVEPARPVPPRVKEPSKRPRYHARKMLPVEDMGGY